MSNPIQHLDGYLAFKNGKSQRACPYPTFSENGYWWFKGWTTARDELQSPAGSAGEGEKA